MKSSILFIFLLISCSLFCQIPDWRFGFEYDEFEPNPLFNVTEASHDTLLNNMAQVTASQSARGGINVNWGGWEQLQPAEGGPIQFEIVDNWVKRFQDHGFEFVFNLTATAKWSFANSATCINPGGLQVVECAPDEDHWDDWYNFVHDIVERYNGDGESDMPVRKVSFPSMTFRGV